MARERRSPSRKMRDAFLQEAIRLTDLIGEDPSPVQIAQALGVPRQNAHKHVLSLEKAGLIERRHAGHAIRVTPAGRRAATHTAPSLTPERQALRERITEAVRALQGNGDPVRREAIVLRVLAQQVPDIEREIEAMVQDGSLMHANGEYTLPDEQK